MIATPIGTVIITGIDDQITGIAIDPARGEDRAGRTPAVVAAVAQLREYFAGIRQSFDLPLAPAGTPRGEALRAGMCAIEYGKRATYGTIAAAVSSSARAVGGACRRNPLPIIVPCHRVVSAGAAEFYSAGAGPATKQWLLDHERRHRKEPT